MRKILFTMAILLGAVTTAARADQTPEQLVRSTADVILTEIKKNRDVYTKDYARLYKMADEKVLPHFDFRRMSQWVLGRAWRDATAEQRDRFVTAFRDLLVRTYSTALLNYKDQELIYLPAPFKPGDDEALVKTEVKQSGGSPNIPIHYSFYKNQQGAWKVYDVTIEGVSLVTNYRSVYTTKIRDKGIDALIAEISDSNRKALAERK